jgi:predicted adenine nucleotide alpha hydrolase (AANH) superfamily ATPase
VALERLRPEFDVTVIFWGSNLRPEPEFVLRRDALLTVNEKLNGGAEVIVLRYDAAEFAAAIQGQEHEPEGGPRCARCFELRLKKAAEYAAMHGFDAFATTLTTGPHKNAALINQIGERLGREHNIKYLPSDFKHNGGFARSVTLSKELGIYRQAYCGCLN